MAKNGDEPNLGNGAVNGVEKLSQNQNLPKPDAENGNPEENGAEEKGAEHNKEQEQAPQPAQPNLGSSLLSSSSL